MSIIHSIARIYASGTGDLIGITRTRTHSDTDVVVLVDTIESSDTDAFIHAPVHGKPGIIIDVITQQSPKHCIPDSVWNEYFSALCKELQLNCITRNATWERTQKTLGTVDNMPVVDGKHTVAVCIPCDIPALRYLNDEPMSNYDEKVIKGPTISPSSLGDAIQDILDAAFQQHLASKKPDTWDPHYKDSDIPDDIDKYENDIPF